MRKVRLFALAFGLGYAAPALASPELVPYYTTTSGWQVMYHSGTGNCAMIRQHQLGTQVIVNYDRSNDSWTFSLSNTRWDRVRNGEQYTVILKFEDGSRWNGNFVGSIWDGRPMISLLHTKTEFIKQFMAHDKMTIATRADGDLTTVNLDGSWDGMLQVAACQKAHS